MNQKLKIKNTALDTNVFIYYFENNANFGRSAKLIFDKLTNNQLRAITNITSLAEILSSPKLSNEAVKKTKRLFLSVPNLEIYQVDENIALESARIRREYGFRLLDAIQLATAKYGRAKTFITNDENLKKFKEVKVILLSELK